MILYQVQCCLVQKIPDFQTPMLTFYCQSTKLTMLLWKHLFQKKDFSFTELEMDGNQFASFWASQFQAWFQDWISATEKWLKIVHVYSVIWICLESAWNPKDVPFPHKNRLASGVEELKNNPHYIASLRRQIISWGLRVLMLICKFKQLWTVQSGCHSCW